MNPLLLIDQHYPAGSLARGILLAHGHEVAGLATAVAARVSLTRPVDTAFVVEAAWLHDIGIGQTATPRLGCHGNAPYIAHGVLGAEILRSAGLPRHALVCERHIGVGLSVADIDRQSLPLPRRDMSPQTVEEEIVAYADLFFSKRPEGSGGPRTVEQVRAKLIRYGVSKLTVFDRWHAQFAPQAPE